MTKRVILIAFMLLGMINVVSADTSNGSLHYVKDFYASVNTVKNTLKQSETGASLACGPTSLLFVYNFYYYKKYKKAVSFLTKTDESLYAIERLYTYLGFASINNATNFSHLKSIAKNRWNFSDVRRRYYGDTIKYNVGLLKNDIKNNKPCLIVLDSKFDRNPTKGSHNIDHIVIAYAYQQRRGNDGLSSSSTNMNRDTNNDRIYFYDPYYGNAGYVKVSEVPRAVKLTGFAYLKVAN